MFHVLMRNTIYPFNLEQVARAWLRQSEIIIMVEEIGRGSSYGTVWATCDEDGNELAIKHIPDLSCGAIMTKRALREVRLLRLLRDHDNIVNLQQIHLDQKLSDLYIVTDMMECNLESIINSPQPLMPEHVQLFTYQLLRGLLYIHSSNVIHRDIKPANLLVNADCSIKICDFGLAKLDSTEFSNTTINITSGVTSRWYRAPEVFLGWDRYTKSIDMWAVGCIVAEMVMRTPIFPSETSHWHMERVFHYLGTPPQDSLHHITDTHVREYVKQHRHSPVEPLESLFPDGVDPECLDFIKRLLCVNPSERLTAWEALRHPYMGSLHLEEDEPVAAAIIEDDAFSFEGQHLGVGELLGLIQNEQSVGSGGGSSLGEERRSSDDGGGGNGEAMATMPVVVAAVAAAVASSQQKLSQAGPPAGEFKQKCYGNSSSENSSGEGKSIIWSSTAYDGAGYYQSDDEETDDEFSMDRLWSTYVECGGDTDDDTLNWDDVE